MRVAENNVLCLGQVDIDDVELNPRSRDDIPAVLQGIQFLHRDKDLLQTVLNLLSGHLFRSAESEGDSPGAPEQRNGINPHVGRPGMSLWSILVLAILKQALNCDCDRLHELACQHLAVRRMMGLSDVFDQGEFSYRTILRNVSLLTPALLDEINQVVVRAGHELKGLGCGQPLQARCDSFVVETDVEYPTDVRLLWDALRSLVRMMGTLYAAFGVAGWRQHRQLMKTGQRLFGRVRIAKQYRRNPHHVSLSVENRAVKGPSAGIRPRTPESGAGRRQDRTELGHVGAQAGSRERTAAGDRGDDLGAAGEDGIGGDALQHALLAGGNVGLEGLPVGGGAWGGLGVEFGAELAEGAEVVEELAAESEQVAELVEVVRPGRSGRKVVEQAEAGEHAGIDAVILRQPPEGFGEAPRTQRIDQHGLDAGGGEALVKVAVVAPGGLEDGARRAAPEQPVAHGAAAALVVLEHAVDAAVQEVDGELRLADINAGDYDGAGFVHSCVPVLLRFGSVPTLPLRSRRNGCGGPTKLTYGPPVRGGNGPARRCRRELANSLRQPPRTAREGICYLPQRWLASPAALKREDPRFRRPMLSWAPL